MQCYLVNELSKNGDGFNTSAYLYKEAGSEPMKMGPLWDYDLSFGNNNYEDLLPQPELLYTVYGSLGRALYALPEFRAEAQRQYTKYITPLGDVLAGDADAVSADGSVHSFVWYREQVAAAAGYDELLWKSSHMDVRPGGNGFAENFASLQNFVVKRVQWLDGVIGKWSADHADPLGDYMDVFESDWYYDTITRATALGLLHGKGAGIFDPSGITTRAQTAQVIYNIAAPGSIAYSDVFPDVAEGSWYASAVLWAQREKIVLGYDDGLFAALYMAELLSQSEKTLGELTDAIRIPPITPDLRYFCPYDRQEECLRRAEHMAAEDGAQISRMDGVRADFGDRWFLIRKSVTAEQITLRAEAQTQDQLTALVDRILAVLPEDVRRANDL